MRKEKERVEEAHETAQNDVVVVEMIGGKDQIYRVLTAVGDVKNVYPGDKVEVTCDYAEHLFKHEYAKEAAKD